MAEALEQSNGAVQDWKAPLAADPEIAPHLPNISERDLPTFVKSHLSLQKKLGDAENRVKQELAAKGMLRQAPDKYEIKRPENLPEGAWNEALEQKAHAWGKKHGLSQEAVAEALDLYHEGIGSTAQKIEVNRAESEKKIVEWLQKEYPGATVEEFNDAIKRFNANPLNGWTEEVQQQLAESGLADYPLAAMAIYKLMKDSGFGETRDDSGSSDHGDSISAEEQEVLDLMSKLNDPRNPEYAKYNTTANQQKIDEYWKKKGQGKQFQIS